MINKEKITSDELAIILNMATVDISASIRLTQSSRCEQHTKNYLIDALNDAKSIGLEKAIERIIFDTKELELLCLVAKHLKIIE